MKKRIVLVAGDAAPSRAFAALEPVLLTRGVEVVTFLCDGKPPAQPKEYHQQIASAIEGADVVLLGLSPTLWQSEVVAGKIAKNWVIPFGFYGDVPRCYARARVGAPFEEFADCASFYFGTSRIDAEWARGIFTCARLIGTGNPLREEYAFPVFSRDEIRAKLNIADDEYLVLAAGCKFTRENILSWMIIMEALAILSGQKRKFHLILTPHPGDQFSEDLEFYGKLALISPVSTRFVGKEELTTGDISAGADLILEFSSALAIQAGFLGIPVITLGLESLFRQIEKERGNRDLEAIESGISELVVSDASKLAETIGRLLTAEGFAPMKIRQQAACPKPTERGATLRKMADAIEMIANK